MKRIFVVNNDQTARGPTEDVIHRLDNLRSEFLQDLSHQLRTPVTAMKLAMEGLFAQIRDMLTPSQRNLAGISRRNIERIVALVENQLDLLQMMAGDRAVCRHLTDLDRLLRQLPRRLCDGLDSIGEGPEKAGRPVILRHPTLEASGPLYAFTDPQLLTAVLDCVMGVGSPSSTRRIHVSYDRKDCVYQLEIHASHLGLDDTGPAVGVPEALETNDFESRAYRTIIDRMGGGAVTDIHECRRWARIRLPRYPEYDREKDFLAPARRLRSMSTGECEGPSAEPAAVHFIRCDMASGAEGDYLESGGGAVCEFLRTADSVLSGGDVVLRGRQHGSIYLALTNRTAHELDHAEAFLRAGDQAGPYVWKPQTILADEREIDRLVRDLELV